MHGATIQDAVGLAVKVESRAAGMRSATIQVAAGLAVKGAYIYRHGSATIQGAAGLAVRGASMANGMRDATIKDAEGGARVQGRVQGGRHASRYHQRGVQGFRRDRDKDNRRLRK